MSKRRSAITGVVIVSCIVLAFGLVASLQGVGQDTATANAAAPAPGYVLVAPLDSVMDVMGNIFTKMPKRLEAGTRREFRALKKEAFFVAEIGNLAAQLKGKTANKEWVELSTKMKTSSVAMATAAGKQDAEGFKKAYDTVKDSCGGCHDKFRD